MKYFLFVSSLLFVNFLFSQEIFWGALQKTRGRTASIIPVKGSEFYTTRYSGRTLLSSTSLGHHQDFDLITAERISAKVNNGAGTYEGAVYFNSQLIVFISDKQVGVNILYRQTYGTDCQPLDEPVEIASYDLPRGLGNKGFFSIKKSANAKYLCVEYGIPAKRNNFDRYGFKVYDEKFSLVSEGEYESEYQSRQSDVSDRYVSNSGEYFLLAKVYNTNGRGNVRDYSSLDKVVLMSADRSGLKTMELALEADKFINDITFFKDETGNIRLSGLYGRDRLYRNTSGIFYMEIDFDSQKVINSTESEFPNELIVEGLTDKQKRNIERKNERGVATPKLWQYELSDIYQNPDGSLVGIMEQYYVTVQSYTDGRGYITYTYTYHYNDIIVYRINANGQFEYSKRIPKLQSSTNDGGYYSSYANYITEGGTLVLFFNDNVRNYDESGNFIDIANRRALYYASFRKKTNCVARVEMDLVSGSMTRSTLFSRAETEAYAVPKLFTTDYINNEMLMLLRFGNKEKFGLVKF